MKKDYIYIKENGVMEVHIDNEVYIFEVKDFKIMDNKEIPEKERVLEALDTAKFLHNYRIDNDLEVWNSHVVTMSK